MEPKKPISNLVAGLIIGVLLIAFNMVIYFADIKNLGALGIVPLCIMVGGLILFVNLYGNANHNQLGFGELFGYGFKTTAVLTLLVIAFTIIINFALPDIRVKQMEAAREQLLEKGNLTADEIDKRLENFGNMFWVFTIGGIIIVNAIVGAIGSAIGAAVTKKKPVNPSSQLNL